MREREKKKSHTFMGAIESNNNNIIEKKMEDNQEYSEISRLE